MKTIIYGKYFKCSECDEETGALKKEESIPKGWMIRFGQSPRTVGSIETDIVYCPKHKEEYLNRTKMYG